MAVPTPSELQAQQRAAQLAAQEAANANEADLEATEDEEDEDDSTSVVDAEGTDSDSEENEAEDSSDYTPPSKEEWQRTQAQLKKVNAEAKKHRLAAKAAAEKAAEGSAEEAVIAARKEVEDKYRPMIVRGALREALRDAGAAGDPARLIKLADISELEIDDDGNIDADELSGVVTALKSDYPELFKTNRAPRADAGRQTEGREPRPLSPSERQAAAVLAARGRA